MQTSIEKIKTQLFQDFLPHIRLIKNIGEGAFSQVYLIYDETKKCNLAVKKIPLFGLCEYQRKMVLNQAKILSSIHHSNIIQFHSCVYDNHEENVYIFMQYAKEGDLLNLMYRTRLEKDHIKQNIIWKIISDITHALNYLHQNGIIHRDIKPANILKQGSQFKLADMNVSKIKEEGVMTRTNVGTPLYTSPQVARNEFYNQKCDIWSLGVVVYELCCFKNPFNMASLNKLKKDTQKGQNSAIQKIPLRYSRSLSDLIKRMLNKDPKKRISIKQILQICKQQGMTINYLSHQNIGQFKTIVFPTTGQRWVNLVHQKKKKQNLDLTIDQILKQSQIKQQRQTLNTMRSQQQNQFSNCINQFGEQKQGNLLNNQFLNDENQIQSIHLVEDQYCLSNIKHKNHILKNVDQNIAKINNFLKRQTQQNKFHSFHARPKIFQNNKSSKKTSQSKDLNSVSVSKDKNAKFQRDGSKQKNNFIHLRQKTQTQYGVKFIKLGKNIQKQHS